MARKSWFSALTREIENELEEGRGGLTFETEQLPAELPQLGLLIIKKKKNVVIEKNIGKIFRNVNIVVYKSPEECVTIEDYHLAHFYSRMYAATHHVDTAEMSVSVVAFQYPHKLMDFLKNQYVVKSVQQGIYFVEGDTSPTQVIVTEELPEKDNFWLANLRNDLSEEQLKRVITAAEGKPSLDAYIRAITETNAEAME